MMLRELNTDSVSTLPLSSHLKKSQQQQQPVQQDTADGWHTIHVFYGNRSALLPDRNLPSTAVNATNGDEPEWFAQVHQDKVVWDLLGDNGYFIDLAANDAMKLSNTLALENHGWDGLCIEPNPVYWYGLSHRRCTVVGALVGEKVEAVDVKFRGVFGGIVGKMEKGTQSAPGEALHSAASRSLETIQCSQADWLPESRCRRGRVSYHAELSLGGIHRLRTHD
jgi:hypothetical protein